MTIFIKQGVKILFIHIPKTGGTTFTDVMTDLGWEASFCIRGKSITELAHLKATPQHYHRRLLKKTFNLEEFDLQLAILRHPFTRIKSEFYWQNRATKDYPEPENWFKTLKEDYKKNKCIYDNHIRPQTHFITPAAEIFKLEDDGIASAINRCQDLIEPHSRPIYKKSELPSKGKSMKNSCIEEKFEKMREKIINFYRPDLKLWNSYKRPIR